MNKNNEINNNKYEIWNDINNEYKQHNDIMNKKIKWNKL
jgi:hypothetical protein